MSGSLTRLATSDSAGYFKFSKVSTAVLLATGEVTVSGNNLQNVSGTGISVPDSLTGEIVITSNNITGCATAISVASPAYLADNNVGGATVTGISITGASTDTYVTRGNSVSQSNNAVSVTGGGATVVSSSNTASDNQGNGFVYENVTLAAEDDAATRNGGVGLVLSGSSSGTITNLSATENTASDVEEKDTSAVNYVSATADKVSSAQKGDL